MAAEAAHSHVLPHCMRVEDKKPVVLLKECAISNAVVMVRVLPFCMAPNPQRGYRVKAAIRLYFALALYSRHRGGAVRRAI